MMRRALTVALCLSTTQAFAQAPRSPQPIALGLETPASQREALRTQPRTGTLHVTVVDQSGAVIPSAIVTVAGVDDATKAAAPGPVQTSEKGIATLTGLPLGRYTVQAEFPGFETRLLPDVRVRAGDNKQVVLLPIQRLQDSVTVGQDRQEAAVDPRGPSFGTTLTREQLEALSDDPDELRRQLQDMAGPGAVIRIDSFEGGALPPKSQIRSIRISRDQFAAENHSAGGIFIEIITQPGIGPIRFNTNFRLRDGSWSGRSPFTPTKGPEQIRNYNLGVGGSLVKDKSSFSLSVSGTSSYETPNLNVALLNGTRSEALSLRAPRDNVSVSGQADYALTLDQTLRFGYSMNRATNRNLGIGAYDVEERAYSTENRFHTFRVQEAGPLGRRLFMRTRLQLTWSDSESHSAVDAPTIRVNDAFTSGGAQVAGGQQSRAFTFASDVDYVRGLHSVRTGIALDGGSYRSNDTSNYLGTYTFESLEAYLEGRPRSYTRRAGDANIRYQNVQAAVYVQDDIRIRRNLTLSPGLRYEIQTHVHDRTNLGPRFGVTWAPFASGRTTLRTSWGIFHDWLAAATYEQTRRVDGFRQRELNIINPSFPDPGDFGIVPPINRYLLGDSLRAPRTTRLSAGIDQGLTQRTRLSATYSYMRGRGLLRGLNLNAPVDGVRPDPVFGNIVEVISDARSRQHTLQTNFNVTLSAPSPALNQARFNWRRLSVSGTYILNDIKNNTDGPFNLPASGSPAGEWGPGPGDFRHRAILSVIMSALRNFSANFNLNGSTGTPYSIRTGLDDNGDLVFNDRPPGVGRNTLRTRAQWALNARGTYTFSLGSRTATLPPGISITSQGGNITVNTVAPEAGRYRLSLFVEIQNLTNHANYAGYSGTLTSPFFGRPTMVSGTRKVDMGLSFNF